MRRNLFWSLCLIFISACGPAPEIIATQTASATTTMTTAWTATSTTMPAITFLTTTFTPNPTVTPSPTIIPTSTITPTLTETPKPKFEFFSGFENGFAGFDEYIARQGAQLEIIDDPTDSGRGKVLKGAISGKAVDQGSYLAYRTYPGKSFPYQAFPCRVQEDIWMSMQFYNDALTGGNQTNSNWYSQLSLFDTTAQNGGRWNVAVTTTFGYGVDYGYMTLNIQDPDNGIQQFQPVLPSAPKFTPEEWHIMAVEVDASGVAHLYQDNLLVTKGELLLASRKALAGAHGGPIYGGPSFSEGGYVLVDNYRVVCWP